VSSAAGGSKTGRSTYLAGVFLLRFGLEAILQ
jgi:hypothetical protein